MNTLADKIMTFKAKSPTNLMRKIKEHVGAKKFLMHKDKIVLDDTLIIYYEESWGVTWQEIYMI